MNRSFYLDLASSGLRMPIGTDLLLHEQSEPDRILRDGQALGAVVAQAARRYNSPLAFAHMDLSREKAFLLGLLGIPAEQAAAYHFSGCPGPEVRARLGASLEAPLPGDIQAHVDSIAYVTRQADLLAIGMTIGPFSLMTKLLADPITPIYLAGSGLSAEEEPEVRTVETLLPLAEQVLHRLVQVQVDAGARAVFVAEPAANIVYVSPKQMEAGSDVFERYVIGPNRRLKMLLEARGVDLVFHCCGEVNDAILRAFCGLDPAILSLGSSRRLWEDAAIVPEHIVMFGNLPSKHFYSDTLTREEVERQTCELLTRMRATRHPFILGSECDVLSVPGFERTIREKVDAFVHCRC
ncbi:MAG TPA: uroporphyrinogen decarboxylase family protein [Candidatus Sulfotelmatobacter sp.]|nr:uroporphyrinogen decarboxylase family protein [Candidatus Sulfotelmatobacter sp.]